MGLAVTRATNSQPVVSGPNVALGTAAGAVGLYGIAGVPRAAAITPVATTAAALASFGYTQAQANSIPVAINAIIAALQGIGVTL